MWGFYYSFSTINTRSAYNQSPLVSHSVILHQISKRYQFNSLCTSIHIYQGSTEGFYLVSETGCTRSLHKQSNTQIQCSITTKTRDRKLSLIVSECLLSKCIILCPNDRMVTCPPNLNQICSILNLLLIPSFITCLYLLTLLYVVTCMLPSWGQLFCPETAVPKINGCQSFSCRRVCQNVHSSDGLNKFLKFLGVV